MFALILSLIGLQIRAQKGRSYDSSGFHVQTLVEKINGTKEFDFHSSISFIKTKKIKEVLLRDLNSVTDKVKTEDGKCQLYLALADCYFGVNAFNEAQPLLIKALEIADKNNLEGYKSGIYNILGSVFIETNMFEKGLESYYKALHIANKGFDSINYPTIHINIATSFYKFGTISQVFADSAINHLAIVIKIAERFNKEDDLNKAYQCLGLIQTDKGNYAEAERTFRKSIRLCERMKDKSTVNYAQYQLARVFIDMGTKAEADSAISYLNLARIAAEETDDASLINEIMYELARAYSNKKDYKLSAYHALRFAEYNDSLVKLENTIVTAELSEKYESAKKEAQISELNLSQKEKQAQIDRQLYMIIGSVVILIFVGFAAFSLYRSNQIRKKVNRELSEKNILIEAQKKEVEVQKELVDEKNKEILDSIRYAKRIQQSLLPTQKYIDRNLSKLKKDDKKG